MSFDSAYLRALSAVLFAAVCAYVGAAVFSAGPLSSTARVQSMELFDTLPLEGIAIRSERPVRGAALSPGVESGLRLGAGTALAQWGEETLFSLHPALFLDDHDGYEHLDAALLNGLDERGLESLLSSPAQPQSHCLGRLVEGHDWYYAAFAPLTETVPEMGRCLLDFGSGEMAQARLVSRREYPTRQLLIFRVIRYDAELLSLRKCSADLVLSNHEGIAVPVEAVQRDEQGNEFVIYISASGQSTVPVESIYKNGRLCLVRPLEEGSLPEGSRVLSTAAPEDTEI